MDDLETAVRLNAAFEAGQALHRRPTQRFEVLAVLVEHAVELVRGVKTGH